MKLSSLMIFFFAIFILCSNTACAGLKYPKSTGENPPAVQEDWINLGVYSARTPALAFDPSLKVVFAGTAGGAGLYVAPNSKNTWQPVLSGAEDTELEGEATFRNTTVWQIGFGSGKPRKMWVLHDFWVGKSAPGSYSEWEHIDIQQRLKDCDKCDTKPSGPRVSRSLAIDPDNPDLLYVGTSGPTENINSGAIYRSTDGGDSWQKLVPAGSDGFKGTITEIIINPYQSRLMYVLAIFKDPEGNELSTFYFSENSGDTWELLLKSSKQRVFDFKLLPLDPQQVIFFIATEQGLFSGVNNLKDIQFNKSLGTDPILSLTFDPQQPEVVYASVQGLGIARGTFEPEDKAFVFGDKSGKGFEFISLKVDPDRQNELLCGDLKRGVIRAKFRPESNSSGSGTFSFSPETTGISARNVHDLDVLPAAGNNPTYLLAATNTGALFRAGENEWQPMIIDKLPYESASAVAFFNQIADGSNFYVGGAGYLAHTTDRGKSWRINESDIPANMEVSDFAISRDGSMLLVAARGTTRNSGRIYRSTGRDLKFEEVCIRDNFHINSVMIHPSNANHIIAGGGNYESSKNAGAFIESFDGGKSWKDTGLQGIVVNAVLFDPGNPDIIYAGNGNKDGSAAPLYKRTERGGPWQPSYLGIAARPQRPGIWGSAVDNMHTLGHTGSIVMGGLDDRRILNFRGQKPPLENDSGLADRLEGIWGAADNHIFAVGEQGAITHYDGHRWAAMESESKRTTDQDLYAVWGRSGSDVYAVGEGGTFLRYNGNSWSVIPPPVENDFYGIWTDAKTKHIYLVGSNGTIIDYFNGETRSIPVQTHADLNGIWGTPGGYNIFAVGAPRLDDTKRLRFTIIRFDGRNWSLMETASNDPGYGQLNGVWGASESDVFAVGDQGTILHFDGKKWRRMESGTTANLSGIWGTSSNRVYAVGDCGTILFYNGRQWLHVDQDPNGNPIEQITRWNAVTGLTYYSHYSDGMQELLIYASTARQGVYASANQGNSWVNLSAPPYTTVALAIGSNTSGGSSAYSAALHYFTGFVTNRDTQVPIKKAKIRNLCEDKDGSDYSGILCFGPVKTRTLGDYILRVKGGRYSIRAKKSEYRIKIIHDKKSKSVGKIINFELRKNN